MIKKLVIIASILVIIGVVGGLITYNQIKHTMGNHETQEKVIKDAFTNVQINTDNAYVEVKPTKEETAKVVLTGKNVHNGINFDASVEDNTLNVELEDQTLNFFNLDFFFTELNLTVYLPEKQYKSIEITNDNGKVQAGHLNSSTFKASTNNGVINLSYIESNKTHVKTDNGRIMMKYVSGNLTGNSQNGEISLVTKALDRPIDLSCDNGRIKIQSDKEPTNVRFDAHVDNGLINILDKYSGGAVIGHGDNLIRLSTDNGSISVTH